VPDEEIPVCGSAPFRPVPITRWTSDRDEFAAPVSRRGRPASPAPGLFVRGFGTAESITGQIESYPRSDPSATDRSPGIRQFPGRRGPLTPGSEEARAQRAGGARRTRCPLDPSVLDSASGRGTATHPARRSPADRGNRRRERGAVRLTDPSGVSYPLSTEGTNHGSARPRRLQVGFSGETSEATGRMRSPRVKSVARHHSRRPGAMIGFVAATVHHRAGCMLDEKVWPA